MRSLRAASLSTLLVLLLLHGCAAQLLHAWREVKRPCPAGCEALGNCNAEFGTCECPFGRTGGHFMYSGVGQGKWHRRASENQGL